MIHLKNPEWMYRQFKFADNTLLHLIVNSTNEKFKLLCSDNPLVSVVIIAYNEQDYILRNIISIAQQKCNFPIEIIYVNNNSDDDTQDIINKFHVKSIFEENKGQVFARQAGMVHAKGRFIICGDADTVYPPDWISELIKPFRDEKIVGSYGRHSFYSNKKYRPLSLVLYESLRDIVDRVRSINRAPLCVKGMSFAYRRDLAISLESCKISYRGADDGRLARLLEKYGKLYAVYSKKSRVWTNQKILLNDKSLFNTLISRGIKELKRINIYFFKFK